jgi:hypothetical protein
MSKEEIKDEINKVLDQLTDKTLEELLSFLKKIEEKNSITLFDRNRLEKILVEDKDLLTKLAK